MKRAYSATGCIAVPTMFALLWLMGAARTVAGETNWYHFPRSFVAVSNTPGGATWYTVIHDAQKLTGIVGPFRVETQSNDWKGIEYDGRGWGYETATDAWAAAVSCHVSNRLEHLRKIYDNVGWVKGTYRAYGAWASYLWLLQNRVKFQSSTTDIYVASGGATSLIASVMVGTIGDYCPQTMVTDVGPSNVYLGSNRWVSATGFPGVQQATDEVFRADFTAYYKLVATSCLRPNEEDSDGDGIPDFADGFDWDQVAGTADDVSSNDMFALWRVYLNPRTARRGCRLRLQYDDSDPAYVSHDPSGWRPWSGTLRVWWEAGSAARKMGSVADDPPGDYVPPGTYTAGQLGFSSNGGMVTLYIETVRPAEGEEVTLEVDPDGDGPAGYTCLDRIRLGAMRTLLEPITVSPDGGETGPLRNPCAVVEGDTAEFEIEVEPGSIADEKIVWSKEYGPVRFVGGNRGRVVSVVGEGSGEAKLKVSVEGLGGPDPTIRMSVTNRSQVAVHLYVVSSVSGTWARTEAEINEVLEGAQRIYEQVGMDLQPVGGVKVITNDDWMVIEAENYPDELWELFDSHTGTGGLEIYFVQKIFNRNGRKVRGVNSAYGCAVATNGNFRTLAHEIGHACGLHDIYDVSTNPAVALTGEVREAWAPDDWNGGPGPLYYEPGLEQAELVRRLLMYGYGDEGLARISHERGKWPLDGRG